MGLFGRNRVEDKSAESVSEAEVVQATESDTGRDADSAVDTTSNREAGPWDSSEDYPQAVRVDLGGLLVPQIDGLRIQVQADPSSGTVSQLSLVTEGSAVQVQPYAAPRKAGMWDDIRGQLKSSINSAGGLVEEVDGKYGTELHAQVTNAEGQRQPARFCGIDGPRWFIRLVFLGQAARNAQAAAALEDAIGSIVVVRGDEAMPMGKAIELRVPVQQSEEGVEPPAADPQRPPITLPERGPEITETR